MSQNSLPKMSRGKLSLVEASAVVVGKKIANLVKQPIGLTFAATEESQAQTDMISSSSGVNPARGIHFILI